MVGASKPFASVPFFWSEQFGTAIRYVGHASSWDQILVDGDMDSGSFAIRYFCDGVHRATASVGRDRDNLEDEIQLEGMAHIKTEAVA